MNDPKLIFSGWADQGYLLLLFAVIICAIAVFDFLVKKRKRRIARLIGYVLIAGSIAGLILIPKYQSAQSADQIVLLTKGYQPSVLDSLMRSNTHYKLFNMEAARQPTGYPCRAIRDIHALRLHANYIDQIELLGEGLKSYELKALGGYAVNYYPGDIPPGIIETKFPHTTEVGKTMLISGTTNSMEASKVLFVNNGAKLDSVLLPASGDFAFSFIPKATGKFNYQLQEYLGDSLVTTYPVPIVVVPQQQLNILLVNDFPIFDTRYLRNHLANAGHEVTVRNRYSLEKFSYEYYNLKNKIAVDLASDRLKDVDILIIDYMSLQKLTNRELRNIYLMVDTHGLTLLLQNVQQTSNLDQFSLFEGMTITRSDKQNFVIKQGIALSEHQFDVAGSALPISSVQSITPLGGYVYLGMGKVGVLSMQHSYQLILNGYHALYASIWNDILQQINKRSDTEFQLDFEEDFPMAWSPLKIDFRSHATDDYEIMVDGVRIGMKHHTQLPNRWTGDYWPTHQGWHMLSVDSTRYR
jgi:hypothetical protein